MNGKNSSFIKKHHSQYLLEIEFAESHNLCSEVLDQVIVKQIVYIRGT